MALASKRWAEHKIADALARALPESKRPRRLQLTPSSLPTPTTEYKVLVVRDVDGTLTWVEDWLRYHP